MMAGGQEGADIVEVLCPTPEELEAEPRVNVPCTEEGCTKTFSTSANLKIHMIQTHKVYKDEDERLRFTRSKQKNLSKVTKQFYCPIQMCNRSIDWGKPFSRLSLLKQHYHMIHAEKRVQCPKCEKGFSTQKRCTAHEKYCGRELACTCGEKHNSVTALYMHAKRKQHDLPEEFQSKRRKQEPVKEADYILVVPVPFSKPEEIDKLMKEPFPLLPHPSLCIPTSASIPSSIQLASIPFTIPVGPPPAAIPLASTPTGISLASHPSGILLKGSRSIADNLKAGQTPSTATTGPPVPSGECETYEQTGANIKQVNNDQRLATSSTQTDESIVGAVQSKQDTPAATSTTAAQTTHSFFHGFLPIGGGPKRHKKTSAIQTNTNWLQEQLAGHMATNETQTPCGQANTVQTQTILDLGSALPGSMPIQNSADRSFTQFSSAPGQFPNQQAMPCSILADSCSQSGQYYSEFNSNHEKPSDTLIPQSSELVSTNQITSATMPIMGERSNPMAPNEVLIQTDLTFHNFLEYNTSETQTFANVSDAMTDTSETPEVSSVSVGVAEPLVTSDQETSRLSTPAADVEMTGLDLLFLASTEHRSHTSLDLHRLDDSSLSSQQTQTQTGMEAVTGHQETQTVWGLSLDELSFLDQYTQTVLSSSSTSTESSVQPSSSMTDTDHTFGQQSGMGLYPPFSFSDTETQTMSVFDLEMFGNSISVQTEMGAGLGSDTGLLGDGLSNAQVQVSSLPVQQEMVSADAQTDAMDFNKVRSRHLSGSQLASSQTQTSFWEDIESIMQSDNFTQTQFP